MLTRFLPPQPLPRLDISGALFSRQKQRLWIKTDTMLDTTHCKHKKIKEVAERVGFEPTVEFPRHSLSRRAPSTARTPLRSYSVIFTVHCFRCHAGESS